MARKPKIKEEIMKKLTIALLTILTSAVIPQLGAHCEIPCGIYDDAMRINMLNEHITTIAKSMTQITELEKAKNKNYNQLVRWITNKETHATKFQEIVTQYFMTQRIKPGQADYVKKITLLHQMLIAAMKCKQTTDLANTKKLSSLVKDFDKLYFKPGEKKKHMHKHDHAH